jgi:hypothetical protein
MKDDINAYFNYVHYFLMLIQLNDQKRDNMYDLDISNIKIENKYIYYIIL